MNNSWDPVKKIEERSKQLQTSHENVLREELQKCILYILSEMEFFKDGVFQGGTALRIVYQNFRFSEDLDFVFQTKDSHGFNAIEKKVVKIPVEVNKWFPFLSVTEGKWQKKSLSLRRYHFKVTSDSLHSTLLLQLEFANIPSHFNKIVPIHYEMYPFPIRVETEEEILMDKVIAFGLRAYLKGRDLWDLYYLVNLRKISIKSDIFTSTILHKASDYGFSLDTFHHKFNQNLELLKREGSSILNVEMKRFMDNRLYNAYMQEFNEITVHIVKFLETVLCWDNHE
jgi:predicted nucleotidyltransferase component of viral defense system